MPGFGRLAVADSRDREFPLRALLPRRASTRVYRYWNTQAWRGDQGDTPSCVGYAWTHWLHTGPTTQPGPVPIVDPIDVYDHAQLLDEWPGEAYDGTSVRGGAKALQARGFITEYRWAATVNEIVQAVLEVGPVVMGTDWLEAMMYPDRTGYVRVDGPVVGGHAYMIHGVNTKTGRFTCTNSWGTYWGKNGTFTVGITDMAKLLAHDGEAALAVERRADAR